MKNDARLATAVYVIVSTVMIGTFFVSQTILGATSTNVTSQVIVGIAAPAVSAVTLNHSAAIVLNPNTTTNVDVNATISDANGCSEITTGTTTVLLFRSGVTSSTCLSSPNTLNCYVATAFTASSSCSSGSQNTTTTFAVQYFAQGTDVSSTASSDDWDATVIFRTPDNTTGSADANPHEELNTLLALNVTTSTINYGTLSANSNSGATDQVVTSTNAGNCTTSLQLSALQTLTSGANTIPTSSQGYSTSTFTYPGTSTALTGSPVTVGGFKLVGPTSTTNVAQATFWGVAVPNNQPTGTYTGTNVFQALFQ
ncbi:MAG TPA: hypothetical protein VMU07_00575 [Candidatus Paceibacterota bacterium]|nr:hypothetical protein [Candidatus Paceibacterota bacterium]